MSLLEDKFAVTLTQDATGASLPLSKYAVKSFVPNGDTEKSPYDTTVYNIPSPTPGNYTLVVSMEGLPEAEMQDVLSVSRSPHHTQVLVYNEADSRLHSQIASYTDGGLAAGGSLNVVSRLYSAAANQGLLQGEVPLPLSDVVDHAELQLLLPNEDVESIPMHDDGLHGDGEADDGVWGATVVPPAGGLYNVQTIFTGVQDGVYYKRTNEIAVNVAPKETVHLHQTASARGTVDLAARRLFVDLPVSVTDARAAAKYRAYFQLWGHKVVSREAVAIAWSSAVVTPTTGPDGAQTMRLEVDLAWLVREWAAGPFTLKDIYIQDMNLLVPLSTDDVMAVEMDIVHTRHVNTTMHAIRSDGYKGEITQEMRFGVKPAAAPAPTGRNLTKAAAGGKLILVHGYCAQVNPWEQQSEDWTDATYFLGPPQTMSHDDFSSRVVAFAEEQGLSSYGLLGHSQGGIISLHTLNYYWSGLDEASGSRKIQSVCSPYHGNSGMATFGGLLELLGGCDTNYDLSLDGAALWLSGISTASLEQTNFYVTEYKSGFLASCNALVNLVLSTPNDGVAETKYSVLDIGNNHGITEGECHVPDMNFPPAYWNKERNAEMNSLAAR